MSATARPRSTRRLLATAAAALIVTLLLPGTAQAAPTMSVSRTEDLARDTATTVTVRGSGYDTDKGIYVAYCVTPPAGQLPTPCGGGADTTGSAGASTWIADDPPRYAEGLTQPYGPGGSFEVTVQVTPTIGDVDCREVSCAVVTRADHTRSADRSQDVIVPVRFAAPAPPPEPEPTPPPGPAPRERPGTAGAASETGPARSSQDTAPREGTEDDAADGGDAEPAPDEEPEGDEAPDDEPVAEEDDEEPEEPRGPVRPRAELEDEVVVAAGDDGGAGTALALIGSGIAAAGAAVGGTWWWRRRQGVVPDDVVGTP